MAKLKTFLKREPILVIAALAAVLSCIPVPPDAAYLGYIDFRTLALLYALMVVSAGLRQAGALEAMTHLVCRRAGSARALAVILVSVTFFSSMLITNDVALLPFVPFTLVLLGLTGRGQDVILVVVLQTAAANLGSMLTPVGNPQNLYLYTHYALSAGDFFRITAPLWALSLLLCLLGCLLLPRVKLAPELGEAPRPDRKRLWPYLGLFALCLLSVFRLLPWGALLAV